MRNRQCTGGYQPCIHRTGTKGLYHRVSDDPGQCPKEYGTRNTEHRSPWSWGACTNTECFRMPLVLGRMQGYRIRNSPWSWGSMQGYGLQNSPSSWGSMQENRTGISPWYWDHRNLLYWSSILSHQTLTCNTGITQQTMEHRSRHCPTDPTGHDTERHTNCSTSHHSTIPCPPQPYLHIILNPY